MRWPIRRKVKPPQQRASPRGAPAGWRSDRWMRRLAARGLPLATLVGWLAGALGLARLLLGLAVGLCLAVLLGYRRVIGGLRGLSRCEHLGDRRVQRVHDRLHVEDGLVDHL